MATPSTHSTWYFPSLGPFFTICGAFDSAVTAQSMQSTIRGTSNAAGSVLTPQAPVGSVANDSSEGGPLLSSSLANSSNSSSDDSGVKTPPESPMHTGSARNNEGKYDDIPKPKSAVLPISKNPKRGWIPLSSKAQQLSCKVTQRFSPSFYFATSMERDGLSDKFQNGQPVVSVSGASLSNYVI